VGDLFADAATERALEIAPLAMRLRPSSLDEFVGQEHVLGEGSALRLAIAEDRVGSVIFFGPPGSGKTTLARIVAATTGAAFEELSAVSAFVADVRGVLARARERSAPRAAHDPVPRRDPPVQRPSGCAARRRSRKG
jgi:putative ATPase